VLTAPGGKGVFGSTYVDNISCNVQEAFDFHPARVYHRRCGDYYAHSSCDFIHSSLRGLRNASFRVNKSAIRTEAGVVLARGRIKREMSSSA